MALFGRRTVIVPLGISCQTAHQIERAQGVIAEITNEIFVPETTPFDWRIVGAGDLERMIAENNPYPASADELVGTKRPYWPSRRCHFWHDPAGDFAAFTAKQAHLWETWGRIGRFERKVFILSNTQNNLAEKAKDPGGFEPRLHTYPVIALAHVLAQRFERPELHVVTRKPLFDGLDLLAHHARELKGVKLGMHFVEPDSSQWHGDNELWDGTLAAILGGKR